MRYSKVYVTHLLKWGVQTIKKDKLLQRIIDCNSNLMLLRNKGICLGKFLAIRYFFSM